MSYNIRDAMIEATTRFSTVQINSSLTRNVELVVRAHEQHMRSERQEEPLSAIALFPALPHATTPDQWKVWWQRQVCWRDDLLANNELLCSTIVMDTQSTLDQRGLRRAVRGTTHAEFEPPSVVPRHSVAGRTRRMPLPDPSFLAAGWSFEVVGKASHVGRSAKRVRALRILPAKRLDVTCYADELDLLVDEERGVLLRFAALIEGQEASTISATEVAFDLAIPESVFQR